MNKFKEWVVIRQASRQAQMDTRSIMIGRGITSNLELRFYYENDPTNILTTGSPIFDIKAMNVPDVNNHGNKLYKLTTVNGAESGSKPYTVSMDDVTARDVLTSFYNKGKDHIGNQAKQYQQFASQNPGMVIGGKKGSGKIIQ